MGVSLVFHRALQLLPTRWQKGHWVTARGHAHHRTVRLRTHLDSRDHATWATWQPGYTRSNSIPLFLSSSGAIPNSTTLPASITRILWSITVSSLHRHILLAHSLFVSDSTHCPHSMRKQTPSKEQHAKTKQNMHMMKAQKIEQEGLAYLLCYLHAPFSCFCYRNSHVILSHCVDKKPVRNREESLLV